MQTELWRLILAKTLFLHGCEHASNKTKIDRMLAIHHFDQAVEMTLKCVATRHNIINSSRQEFRFKDLWNEGVTKGGNLPLKEQMFTLHDIRNLIQHAGIIPPYEEVIKFKGYVKDFLKNVIETEFNIKFDELSLASLIENEDERKAHQKY